MVFFSKTSRKREGRWKNIGLAFCLFPCVSRRSSPTSVLSATCKRPSSKRKGDPREESKEKATDEGRRRTLIDGVKRAHRMIACLLFLVFLSPPRQPHSDHAARHRDVRDHARGAPAIAEEKKRLEIGEKTTERPLTCTSLVVPGSTIPLDGRTANFFGAVVLSLNATRSEPGLCRLSVAVTFLRSSKRKRSSAAVVEVGKVGVGEEEGWEGEG